MNFIFDPADLPEEIRSRIEMAHMRIDLNRQAIENLLDSEDEDILMAVRAMLNAIIDGRSKQTTSYFLGRVDSSLTRRGLCPSCGRNHAAEEHANFLGDEGNVNNDGEVSNSEGNEAGDSWDVDTTDNHNMIEYRLTINEDGKLVCKDCGHPYVSLEDRMLRDPDECAGCQMKAKFG